MISTLNSSLWKVLGHFLAFNHPCHHPSLVSRMPQVIFKTAATFPSFLWHFCNVGLNHILRGWKAAQGSSEVLPPPQCTPQAAVQHAES